MKETQRIPAARGPFMGPPGAAARVGTGTKARDAGAALRRAGRFLREERWWGAFAVALTAASVLLSTLGPWQLGLATDLIVRSVAETGRVDAAAVGRQLALVAGLYAGAAALNWWQAWLITGLVQKVSRRLRRFSEEKLSRLPLDWFDRQPHGEALSRVTNDIDNITQSLQQLLSQLLMSLLTLAGVLAMMLLLSPLLATVSVASLALSVLVTRLVAIRAKPHFSDQWKWTGKLSQEVEESYTGHTLVRVYGHQARTIEAFSDANAALRDSAFRAQAIGGLIQPATMFINNLSFIVIVVAGAFRILAGAATVGEVQALIQYIRHIGHPMAQVAALVPTVQSGLASAERVFELLDAPEMAPAGANPVIIETPRGHVVFEHVSFRYVPDRPLFEDVSLEAKPGQTIAIVGPTGAGKTTLVNLLMRFYEIDSGAIRLDGVDIRQTRREDLRRHFGMVLQDAWLFSGSIRDNIAYGRPEASPAEVLEAAQACHVDDFVRTLPEGYDTLLDEGGSELSTGQRQLLTIARAFLLRPAVLILDEATSSVDTRTELLVQRAMARLRHGRTSFVIAHRLSTIRDADVIVYMEAGNVLEQGTHEDLLARKGRYWKLHQSQFAVTDGATAA